METVHLGRNLIGRGYNNDDNPFEGKASLKKATVGSNVTTIGTALFANCTGLTELHSKNPKPPKAYSSSFQNIVTKCKLYVPASAITEYGSAAGWKDVFNILSDDGTTPQPCATPSITVSNITQTSAVINSTGSASEYAVQYKTSSASPWTSKSPNPTIKTTTLSALSPNTTYNVRVKAICSPGNESEYSSENFKTLAETPSVTLYVSPTSYNFSASGGTSSNITVTSDQSWTISDNASWLTTSKTSGSNNSTFTMTAQANSSTSSRTATVTVSGGGKTATVSVTQAGATETPITLSVSPTSYNFSASGGTSSNITVTSNLSWTISDNASWLTTSKTSGSNNSTFTMTAQANSSSSSRTETVTVSGGGKTETVSVTQAGAAESGKPELQLISLAANGTLYQNQNASFTATLKNNGTATYNSHLWVYLEKTHVYTPNLAIDAGIVSIAPGETKTITVSGMITLPPDKYACNMIQDVNNNPSNMSTYQFDGTVLGVQLTVYASNTGQSWQIGWPKAANVIATFNNGTLTITGSGEMDDRLSPWYNIREQIKSVVINNGITRIGSEAFRDCRNMTSISIPNSITAFGARVFVNTGITTITIPQNVSNIGFVCFGGCPLKEIYCNNPTPPNLGENVFFDVNRSTCKLYVPKSAVNAYKTANQWKDFFNILAGIEQVQQNPIKVYPNPVQTELFIEPGDLNLTKETAVIYNMQGQEVISHRLEGDKAINVSHLTPGVYILKVGAYTSKFIKE